MNRLLLVLLPLLLGGDALMARPPGPDFPAEGERLATVVYAGQDPAAGPLLARLGYDTFVSRPDEDLAAAFARSGGQDVILVSDQGPDSLQVAGWVTFDLAPAATAVPTLVAEGPLGDEAVQKALRRFIATHAPLPPRGLKGVEFVASPNWSMRTLGGKIDTVVLHSTVVDTMEATQAIFLDDKERKVSAHYVVDRDGTIVQMVDERLMAHHAGVSELDGRTGVNDFSVGIEMVNRNDGVDPYPDAQYEAVARILRDLRTRWSVPDDRIVSHAQIARPEGRKSDPLGFDFDRLRRMLAP